jgi:hypothetical protein
MISASWKRGPSVKKVGLGLHSYTGPKPGAAGRRGYSTMHPSLQHHKGREFCERLFILRWLSSLYEFDFYGTDSGSDASHSYLRMLVQHGPLFVIMARKANATPEGRFLIPDITLWGFLC